MSKKITIQIYKDKSLSAKRPWRAKVSDGKCTFTTGMYKTQKAILEIFQGCNITKIRRKDLDCK